jgi:hypothetical protein
MTDPDVAGHSDLAAIGHFILPAPDPFLIAARIGLTASHPALVLRADCHTTATRHLLRSTVRRAIRYLSLTEGAGDGRARIAPRRQAPADLADGTHPVSEGGGGAPWSARPAGFTATQRMLRLAMCVVATDHDVTVPIRTAAGPLQRRTHHDALRLDGGRRTAARQRRMASKPQKRVDGPDIAGAPQRRRVRPRRFCSWRSIDAFWQRQAAGLSLTSTARGSRRGLRRRRRPGATQGAGSAPGAHVNGLLSSSPSGFVGEQVTVMFFVRGDNSETAKNINDWFRCLRIDHRARSGSSDARCSG